jgi:tetratricopeptide (TPR) repeat protein
MENSTHSLTKPRRWELGAIALVAACFVAGGLMRLNDLSLYTDSTRYLIWANSLSEGKGFLDPTSPEPTRFVMNAPLYPILLVPSQLISSWSLAAAKVWTLLWGALAVVLLFVWMRRSFSAGPSLFASAFLGLHPLFFVVSTEVLSEAPFIALMLVLLLTIEPLLESKPGSRWPLLAAILLVLLPLVREVGFAFAVATAVVLLNTGRIRRAIVLAGAAAIVIGAWNLRNSLFLPLHQGGQEANLQFMFGHFVTAQGESLASEFVRRLWLNAQGYAVTIAGSLFHPFPSSLVHAPSLLYSALESVLTGGRIIVFVAALGLAVHGALLDINKPRMGLFAPLAVLFFGLIVLVYPVHELRFVLPILPLLLYFILRSVTALGEHLLRPSPARNVAGIGLAAILIFPNAVAVTELVETDRQYVRNPEAFAREVFDSGDPSAFYTRPWSVMGAWMTTHVPEGAVIASPAKEIAPFIRGHAVLELSRTVPRPLFDQSLRDNAVDYVLATTVWADFRSYEFAMTESGRFWFEPLHTAGTLVLLRVHRTSASPRPQPERETDTAAYTAPSLLRRGRRHLLNLDYIEALGTLNEAARLAPMQSEITAQQILASSVVGDVRTARALIDQLFTMPQSTSHIALAQAHVGLAEQLKSAFEATSSEERSALAISAGRGYWELGYQQLALRVMQNVLRLDSTSFEAALWACHYARQSGDTLLSRRYLGKLRDIDVTAPILADLEAIDAAGSELSRTSSAAGRVRLLERLAGVYEKLELSEEALDDLEKALAIAPENTDVRSSMARIFKRKGALVALHRLFPGERPQE